MASHITNTMPHLDKSHSHFPLKKLPVEVRMRIYPYKLRLRHDKQASPLLLALAADKDLYGEARKVYKVNICFTTNSNCDPLKQLSLSKIFKFRHLKFAWEGHNPYASQYVQILRLLTLFRALRQTEFTVIKLWS